MEGHREIWNLLLNKAKLSINAVGMQGSHNEGFFSP